MARTCAGDLGCGHIGTEPGPYRRGIIAGILNPQPLVERVPTRQRDTHAGSSRHAAEAVDSSATRSSPYVRGFGCMFSPEPSTHTARTRTTLFTV